METGNATRNLPLPPGACVLSLPAARVHPVPAAGVRRWRDDDRGHHPGLRPGSAAIGFAVLRYRLYDIDKIVSRTVSYAVITATLAGVYVGGVALLTGVLPFSGQARTAVSVLIAVALFAPLRRRVQRAVDRRFNRARYDSEAVLAAFAQRMREQADIDAVRADLAAAVTRSLDPGHVSLWVRAGP